MEVERREKSSVGPFPARGEEPLPAWHDAIELNRKNVERFFRVGTGAEVLDGYPRRALRLRHRLNHLIDVQLLARDAGHVAAFADKLDERRPVVESSDLNHIAQRARLTRTW